MKFNLAALLALMPLAAEAGQATTDRRVRRVQGMAVSARTHARHQRRVLESSGGLMKNDYIMDWRPMGPPKTMAPTTSQTMAPSSNQTVAPTPSRTLAPVGTPAPTPSTVNATEQPVAVPVTPAPIAAPVTEQPVAVPFTVSPSPVNVSVTESPSPVAVPVTVSPSPVAEPVTVSPSPVAEPVTVSPSPVAANLTESPSPVAGPVTVSPSPVAGPATEAPGAGEFDCNVLDFVFLEVPNDEELDILNDDYSPGDVFTFDANEVFVGETFVGTSNGRCVVLENIEDFDNLYCTIEFQFGGGTLSVQGVFYELVAIGGTGCYSEVTGYIELADDPDGLDRYGYQFVFENDNAGCPPDDATALLTGPWTELRTNESDTLIDWDLDGALSSGDVIVFDGTEAGVFTTAGGATGFLEGECMVLYDPVTDSGNAASPFCTITFFTELGDILQVQGPYDNMVITSALGCFFNTTGSISAVASEESFDYTLNIDNAPPEFDCSPFFDEPWIESFGDFFVDYIFDPDVDDGVDDSYDAFTPGDGYLFENKVIFTAVGEAVGSGRCMFLADAEDTFCNIVFTIEGSGSIAVQGFFGQMAVVGGSGCFQHMRGVVSASELETGFEYVWSDLYLAPPLE